MKRDNKIKQTNIKAFLFPLIVITLIFFILGHTMIKGIKRYHYDHMEKDSLNLAISYSRSLSKGTEAYDVANKLLEDKLLVASRTTALYNDQHSNKILEELSEILKVDEIYSYNTQGEIEYSNTGESIGWKAYEGHPVYDFIISKNKSLVEDIRQDTETGIYYKYGYFKISNGRFVQIGVRADKIYDFLGSFEMHQLLDEMKDMGVVDYISFIDNEFNIIGSTQKDLIGKKIQGEEAIKAILENREYGFINNEDGNKSYEIFVPVYFGERKIGTLATSQSLKDTEMVVRYVSTIGILTLMIIYIFLLYIMGYTYKKNRELIRLAYYDSLTDLPNKHYLEKFLAEEIQKDMSNKALMLFNCINFRIVNFTYGYDLGDQILKEIAQRIDSLSDKNMKLFRFSADRFILYIKNYDNRKDLISLVDKINRRFDKPFKVKDTELNLSAEIGITEINNKYNDVDRLLMDASISLNNINKNATLNYIFFNKDMEKSLQRESIIEKTIRKAISEKDTKELYLEFQPQVDLQTNKIVSFEALARMKTEILGTVSPDEFIEVAERTQLIVPLGNFILKKACEFMSILKKEGFSDIKVAVNISGIQLLRDDFTDTVLEIIEEFGIEKSNLELEITETVLFDNYDIINAKLKTLRDHNIRIALDDFGIGYSCFSRIRELNIDIVKIDRYFINSIAFKENKQLITADIISMAHKLGLIVVAEGVEFKIQTEYLKQNKCDIIQGYIISKSLPPNKAIALLKSKHVI